MRAKTQSLPPIPSLSSDLFSLCLFSFFPLIFFPSPYFEPFPSFSVLLNLILCSGLPIFSLYHPFVPFLSCFILSFSFFVCLLRKSHFLLALTLYLFFVIVKYEVQTFFFLIQWPCCSVPIFDLLWFHQNITLYSRFEGICSVVLSFLQLL